MKTLLPTVLASSFLQLHSADVASGLEGPKWRHPAVWDLSAASQLECPGFSPSGFSGFILSGSPGPLSPGRLSLQQNSPELPV